MMTTSEASFTDLHGVDSETRERHGVSVESLASPIFSCAAVQGKEVSGPELELRQAAGVDGIPLEIFDTPDELEKRVDVTTAGLPGSGSRREPRPDSAPDLRPIRSAQRLGVAMPQVPSGTYSTATISTSLTAGARVAGMPQDSMSAAFAGWNNHSALHLAPA